MTPTKKSTESETKPVQPLLPKDKLGRDGEVAAARWLEENGYQILGNNVRLAGGEIDLIVIDKLRDELVFVEVKTRRSDTFGFPEEAIGFQKRRALLRAASAYRHEHAMTQVPWRVDVVAVTWCHGTAPQFHHMIDVFSGLTP